jgi:3-phosphoshikimate 1-carboxyvinyltransferase
MAIAALCPGPTVITGDDQIQRRSVMPLVKALRELGAEAVITRPGADAPPVVIRGPLSGGTAHFVGLTSPPISAVLLAAAIGTAPVTINVEAPRETPYIDMTLRWMERFGVTVAEQSPDYRHFRVAGGAAYRAADATVPGDWSSAAFPLVAAVCCPGDVAIGGLDLGDVQGDKAVVDHLLAMGAHIDTDAAAGPLRIQGEAPLRGGARIDRDAAGGRLLIRGGTPLRRSTRIDRDAAAGPLRIRGGTPLHGGTRIDLTNIPDALPALAVAACRAQGPTTFTGLAHVRLKETDRVAVMEAELTKLGATVTSDEDTLVIHGTGGLEGGTATSHGDHRVAMALAVAGLFSRTPVVVKGAECVAVSFPRFFALMNRLGAGIELGERIE